MGRLGRQLGPDVVQKVNERVVEIARQNKVVGISGRADGRGELGTKANER